MTSRVSVLFLILASGIQLSLGDSSDWSYSGENGPNNWPGVCTTGKKQSPINIVTDETIKADIGELKFHHYDYAYDGSLTNTGHTVELDLTGVPLKFEGGSLQGSYIFEQMHFHWDAEHTIDDEREKFEVHFVHFSDGYDNFTDAAQWDWGLSVIAVLYKIGENDNPDLEPIVEATKSVSAWVGPNTAQIQQKIIPMALLPKDRTNFYRYEGSLTTPKCHESVTWFIFNEKLTISEAQLKVFENVMSSNGLLKSNYRPVRKLESREVYHRLPGYQSGASIPSLKIPIYLSTFIIFALLLVP